VIIVCVNNEILFNTKLTEGEGDPAHAMKIFEGVAVRLHSFLHSALDGDGVGSFTSGPLHPRDPPSQRMDPRAGCFPAASGEYFAEAS